MYIWYAAELCRAAPCRLTVCRVTRCNVLPRVCWCIYNTLLNYAVLHLVDSWYVVWPAVMSCLECVVYLRDECVRTWVCGLARYVWPTVMSRIECVNVHDECVHTWVCGLARHLLWPTVTSRLECVNMRDECKGSWVYGLVRYFVRPPIMSCLECVNMRDECMGMWFVGMWLGAAQMWGAAFCLLWCLAKSVLVCVMWLIFWYTHPVDLCSLSAIFPRLE